MRLPFVRRRKGRVRRPLPKVFRPQLSVRKPSLFRAFSTVLGIFLLGLGIYFFFRLNLLSVVSIDCRVSASVFYKSSSWCAQVKELVLGQSLLTINSQKLLGEIKESLPLVEDLEAGKHWPNSLKITLIGKTPLAAVGFTTPGNVEKEATSSAVPEELYLVDAAGLIIAQALAVGSLPLLIVGNTRKLNVGEKIESGRLKFCLELIKSLGKLGVAVERVDEDKRDFLVLTFRQGPLVFVSLEKDVKEQALVLHLVLEKYKIEGKALKKVDLRFGNPVVVY